MTYVYAPPGTSVGASLLNTERIQLPHKTAKRFDTGQWIGVSLRDATVAEQEACGWYDVVEAVDPGETATTTRDRDILWSGVAAVETFTVRNKTQEELDEDAEDQAQASRRSRLDAAVTWVDARRDEYTSTDVGSMNNNQIRDWVANLTADLALVFDRLGDLLRWLGRR